MSEAPVLKIRSVSFTAVGLSEAAEGTEWTLRPGPSWLLGMRRYLHNVRHNDDLWRGGFWRAKKRGQN